VRAGRRGQLVHADLSDVGGLPDVVEQAVAGLGAIDVLVNNAAAPSRVPLVEVGETTWREVLELDLTSPWRLSQIVARQMIERGVGGSIVNLSSSSAFRARRAHGAYGVAKAAVVALTRIMAGELGAHGINVNAVAPGVTATAMGGLLGDVDALQSAVSEGPLENLFHRVSTSDDVANAIVFLCSSASRQITGQVVHTSAGAVISA
jgi:NAD(P)-dependent dehydrogenase (short-subunit alcohol dehydrogenase family)